MHDVLVVVYSYTGNSRMLAGLLASEQRWPIAEVEACPTRIGLRGVLACAFDSLIRRRPKIAYQGPPPDEYRVVVLVAPIWIRRLAAPMRTFICEHRQSLHQVCLLTTMGGHGGSSAAAELEKLLGRPPLMSVALRERELLDGSCVARIDAIGRAINDSAAKDAMPTRPLTLSPRST